MLPSAMCARPDCPRGIRQCVRRSFLARAPSPALSVSHPHPGVTSGPPNPHASQMFNLKFKSWTPMNASNPPSLLAIQPF